MRGIFIAVLLAMGMGLLIAPDISAAPMPAGGSAIMNAATSAKLYGVVLRILRRHDLAQDVLEQTYMQIWNTAGDFDPTQASPFAWLVGLARRRAIDLARRPDTMASTRGVSPTPAPRPR